MSSFKTTATTSSKEVITTLRTNYYGYDIEKNITIADGFTSDKASVILDMISKGTSISNISYWIASRCVIVADSKVFYRVNRVNSGWVNFCDFYDSDGKLHIPSDRVRPVVSLKLNISLLGVGDDVGTEGNMWSIVEN